MGALSLVVCIAATIVLFGVSRGLGAFALIVTILNFWSLGIMRNFGGYGGVSGRYERLVITVNMLTSVTGLILLIVGFVRGC